MFWKQTRSLLKQDIAEHPEHFLHSDLMIIHTLCFKSTEAGCCRLHDPLHQPCISHQNQKAVL